MKTVGTWKCKSGLHLWSNISTFRETHYRYVCRRCGARKVT